MVHYQSCYQALVYRRAWDVLNHLTDKDTSATVLIRPRYRRQPFLSLGVFKGTQESFVLHVSSLGFDMCIPKGRREVHSERRRDDEDMACMIHEMLNKKYWP